MRHISVISGEKTYRVKADTPNPVPHNYTVIGFDESGFFPPKKDEYGKRFQRMILYAATSRNPIDGGFFKDGMTRSAYMRENPSAFDGLWAELNGVHSRDPDLVGNNILTRMVSAAYLISVAGYDGLTRTRARIDRFWPDAIDDVFFDALNYFGVYPQTDTIAIKAYSDTHVPVVRAAHERSRRLWSSSTRHKEHADSRIDIPPELILRCMMDLEKHGSNLGLLCDEISYQGIRPH